MVMVQLPADHLVAGLKEKLGGTYIDCLLFLHVAQSIYRRLRAFPLINSLLNGSSSVATSFMALRFVHCNHYGLLSLMQFSTCLSVCIFSVKPHIFVTFATGL
jgi:hypothetical protein